VRCLCFPEARVSSTRGFLFQYMPRAGHPPQSRLSTIPPVSRDSGVICARVWSFAMSSDGFVDDFSFDSAALDELDAIEAAYFALPRPNVSERQDLGKFEDMDEDQPIPVAGPSNHQKNHFGRTVQTTLLGTSIPSTSKSKNAVPGQKQSQRSQSNSRNPFGQQAKKSKAWDHTEFAKTGWRRSKSKTKPQETLNDNDDGEEEEAVEFEQFPAPVVPGQFLLPSYFIHLTFSNYSWVSYINLYHNLTHERFLLPFTVRYELFHSPQNCLTVYPASTNEAEGRSPRGKALDLSSK
jgi:hypothetical protein